MKDEGGSMKEEGGIMLWQACSEYVSVFTALWKKKKKRERKKGKVIQLV